MASSSPPDSAAAPAAAPTEIMSTPDPSKLDRYLRNIDSDLVAQNCKSFTEIQRELLELEAQTEREEVTELLQTCTHNELAAMGMVLLKMYLQDQATALYGRMTYSFGRYNGGDNVRGIFCNCDNIK